MRQREETGMYDPGRDICLRGSARSDTGRVRDNNEDSVDLWQRDNLLLAIVADGMGGAVAGEEASRITIESIRAGLGITEGELPETYNMMDQEMLSDQMQDVIREANDTIVDRAESHPELKGMGTTITLAFVRERHVLIGHVGDSRAYLVDGSDGHIIQVTSDHSFVQALVTAGHISEDEAEDHPMKNVLYRALGQASDVEVDIYYERLNIGDRLVLCSDGLTLHVKPREIAQVALAADDPDECSRKLIELANNRGGRDNVSVIVIHIEDAEELRERSDKQTRESMEGDTLIIDKQNLTVVPPDEVPQYRNSPKNEIVYDTTPDHSSESGIETTGEGRDPHSRDH